MINNGLSAGLQASQAYDEGSIPFTRSNEPPVISTACGGFHAELQDASERLTGVYPHKSVHSGTRVPKKSPKHVPDSPLTPSQTDLIDDLDAQKAHDARRRRA